MAIPTSIESGKAQVFDQNPYDSPQRRAIYARILQDHEEQARRRKEANVQLGKDQIDSASLLPIDQVKAAEMAQDLLQYGADQRKQNIDVTNPNSGNAYLEAEKKKLALRTFINAKKQDAILLNELKKKTELDRSGAFDAEETNANLMRLMNDPNRDLSSGDIVVPAFNPMKVKQDAVNLLKKEGIWKDVVDQKTGKTIVERAPNGTLQNKQEFVINEEAILDQARMVNDPSSTYGRKAIRDTNKTIATLPKEAQDKIYGEVKKHYGEENFDPANMTEQQKADAARVYWHDVIKNNLPEGTRVIGIRDPFKESASSIAKNTVKANTGRSVSPEYIPLFNTGEGEVTKTDVATPPEGESKEINISAPGAFTLDKGQRSSIDTRGKDLKGKVLDVVSKVNPNTGLVDVYAEVSTNSLSNKDMNQGLYNALKAKEKAYEDDHDNAIPLTDAEEVWLKKADEKTSNGVRIYVPFRSVAKNWKTELENYKNFDVINEIEKQHGIKFTDYVPDPKKSGYTTNQQGAINAFVSQYKRNPTKSELDKILSKFK